jgi:hypothetical protein
MRSFGGCIAVPVFLSAMASASSKPPPIEVKVLKAESYTFKSRPMAPITTRSAPSATQWSRSAQVGDLSYSQFGHHSDRYSRLISSAASCARGSEEYISSA